MKSSSTDDDNRWLSGWFIRHLLSYLGLLFLAWALIIDDPGFLGSAIFTGVGARLSELLASSWVLMVLFGLPTAIGLLVILAIGQFVSGWRFRVIAVIVMLLSGIFVATVPSLVVWASQFLVQLIFGMAIRRPPAVRPARRSGDGFAEQVRRSA